MPTITNGRILFNSVPGDLPEPGKTTIYDESQALDLDTVPLNGGFLVKLLEISVDPYMKGRMHATSYEDIIPPFIIGKPLFSFGIGVVLRSENLQIRAGDHLHGMLEHAKYSVQKDPAAFDIIHNPLNLPWSNFLSVLGRPGKVEWLNPLSTNSHLKSGKTAFMAWREFAKAKKGEIVFVSTGAGSVGSLVIQFAKMDGLKVVASAGSDEKVQYMKGLGADVAFNYKTTKTADILRNEGPIDIYWDNVGGATLDAALEAANVNARFIECGMTTEYTDGGNIPVKKLLQIIIKSITLHGFFVDRLCPKWNEVFMNIVPSLVASEKLGFKEETFQGLEVVGHALLDLLKGKNVGKVVVHVAED
ncbi:hypothetical protein CVT26_002296 [Gymnopilus dilepis]|uniref:Enoyl reductase (ER) domain-containing protein n=1 Tax=Gymnopilus dilepis TaxID=231916 RepID=A0A409WE76_9AGAR|nr:hypothetical protein CVT26_002296 [Gymnopilus dilepis]